MEKILRIPLDTGSAVTSRGIQRNIPKGISSLPLYETITGIPPSEKIMVADPESYRKFISTLEEEIKQITLIRNEMKLQIFDQIIEFKSKKITFYEECIRRIEVIINKRKDNIIFF